MPAINYTYGWLQKMMITLISKYDFINIHNLQNYTLATSPTRITGVWWECSKQASCKFWLRFIQRIALNSNLQNVISRTNDILHTFSSVRVLFTHVYSLLVYWRQTNVNYIAICKDSTMLLDTFKTAKIFSINYHLRPWSFNVHRHTELEKSSLYTFCYTWVTVTTYFNTIWQYLVIKNLF
jgi:hypothetical protein